MSASMRSLHCLLAIILCSAVIQLHGERIRMDTIPSDGASVFYLGTIITKDEYKARKAAEGSNCIRALAQEITNTVFKIRHHKYFTIAYACSERVMDEAEPYLTCFFRGIYPRFFIYEPVKPIRIVYLASKEAYTEYSGGFSGYGHYSPLERTIYTYASSGYGTLWHELIHAFTEENTTVFCQQWFSEGFASFYEMGVLSNCTVIEGYANWRHPDLQKAVKYRAVPPLNEFLLQRRMSGSYGYAQARFFFCYLWVNRVMDQFIKQYMYDILPSSTTNELGPKTITAVETLLGKNIAEIEKEYRAMVLSTGYYEKLKIKKPAVR